MNPSNRPRSPDSAGDRWEEELTRCLNRVPVPDGLANRILDRLRTESSAQSTDCAAAEADSSAGDRGETTIETVSTVSGELAHAGSTRDWNASVSATVAPASRRLSRRALVGLIAAAAAVALLGVGAWLWPHRQATPQRLAVYAIQHIESESVGQSEWLVDRGAGPLEAIGQLDLPLVLIGCQPVSPGRYGTEAYLWKYASERGDLVYVVEIRNATRVHGADERLRPVNLSNQSWSVAIAQIEDRALVVCSLMDLRLWIQAGQVA